MLERGSRILGCFLDVRRASDTVWIDGILFRLFTELGIEGKMWLAIKDLYTGVKAQVLYSGSLSRSFDVSQRTGQGRILAPFVCKVYINSLLYVLSDHKYAICIRSLQLTLLSLEGGGGVESTHSHISPSDTVWIDGILFKLFTELGIEGKMWLAINDLSTRVKAQVLYSGSLSRSFDVSQRAGQGRILAPFMCKVYINSLLYVYPITNMQFVSEACS